MINKLEMLIALEKEAHFGRAAERLGLTQPTLSSGIRQLEDHLGVRLVQRGSRYGGLTPEGQRTLVWARQIVGDSRLLRAEMRASRDGLSGDLRLGVIPTALTWASRLVARYSKHHPNVRFKVISRSSSDILRQMESLDLDAGITYLDNEPLGRVSTRFLYQETYVMVCASDHPMATRKHVTWTEVAEQDLCLLIPEMQNRRIINRAFMDAGITPHPGLEANSTVILMAQVAEAGRVTVLPRDQANFLAAGHSVKLLTIGPDGPHHDVGLVAPQQSLQTPVLEALMRVASNVSSEN